MCRKLKLFYCVNDDKKRFKLSKIDLKDKNIVNVDYLKSLIPIVILFDDHMSHRHLAWSRTLCAHELYQKSIDYKNFNIGFIF